MRPLVSVFLLVLFIFLLLILLQRGWSAGNETINTIPDATQSTFNSRLQTFDKNEIPNVLGRYFRNSFVVHNGGGLHGGSGTCVSPAFATEAFTNSGNRVTANGAGGAVAIDYCDVSIGGNGAADTCWVVISPQEVPTLPATSFSRVGSSHYYVQCGTVFKPVEPADSAYLMRVTLAGGAITVVQSLANDHPFTSAVASLKDFGAVGDGVTDDTAAIQAAIDSGKTLWCDEGTYRLATITPGPGDYYVDNHFLTLRDNLGFLGGGRCVLQIGDHILDGATDLTSNVNIFWGAGVSNVTIQGIFFDHNGPNNLTPAGKTRTSYAVKVTGGQNITITNNTFVNTSGHNYITLQNNNVATPNRHAIIAQNYFVNGGLWVGVSNPNNADFTAVYTELDDTHIDQNTFYADNIDYFMNGDRAAMECHASRCVVTGNTVRGGNPALWITPANTGALGGTMEGVVVTGNAFLDVHAGIHIAETSYRRLKGVTISGNVMELNRSTLQTSEFMVGIMHPNGASQTVTFSDSFHNVGAPENVSITNNIITSNLSALDSTYGGFGLYLHGLTNWYVADNVILGMPTACIFVDQSPYGITGLWISKNRLMDCGRNAGTAASRAGVYFDFAEAPSTTAYFVKDVRIEDNTFGNTHTETFDAGGVVQTIASTGLQYSGVTMAGLTNADLVEGLYIINNRGINLPYMVTGGATPYVLEQENSDAHYGGRRVTSALRPASGRLQLFPGDTVVYPDGLQASVFSEGWTSAKTSIVTGTSGETAVQVADATELRVGMTMHILGAGTAGGTLDTKILSISSVNLVVETAIITSVVGATFTIVNPVFVTPAVTVNVTTNANCADQGGSNYACTWTGIGGTLWNLLPASMTLVQVNGLPDGQQLILRCASTNCTIVNNTAKIRLAGAVNYVLADADSTVTTIGSGGVLVETARATAH